MDSYLKLSPDRLTNSDKWGENFMAVSASKKT